MTSCATWGRCGVPAGAVTKGPCLSPWLCSSRKVSANVWLKSLLENMGMFPVGPAIRGHVDVRGQCRNDPAPHRMQCSGDLVPSFTGGSILKSEPCVWFRQHSGAGLVAEVWVSCPEGMNVRELTLPFICHGLATGTEVVHPSPYHL